MGGPGPVPGRGPRGGGPPRLDGGGAGAGAVAGYHRRGDGEATGRPRSEGGGRRPEERRKKECPSLCSDPAATPLPLGLVSGTMDVGRLKVEVWGDKRLGWPGRPGAKSFWRQVLIGMQGRVPLKRPPAVNRNMPQLPRGIPSRPSGDQEISKISNFSGGYQLIRKNR